MIKSPENGITNQEKKNIKNSTQKDITSRHSQIITAFITSVIDIIFFFLQDASIILMKYRAGATIINGAGETPLHIAARYTNSPRSISR